LHWLNEDVATRRVDYSAFTAVLPVVALFPPWLVAVFLFWVPFAIFSNVAFATFALSTLLLGIVLFSRPVQRIVFVKMLGARTPSTAELERLEPLWNEVAQANHFGPDRFVLAVADGDDLNAFACGGHLLVVSSFAVERLTDDELTGVLAHELSHHLGGHTVALTIAQWMSLPIIAVARLGFLIRNVSDRATVAVSRKHPNLRFIGIALSFVLTSASRVMLLGLVVAQLLGNAVGRGAEYQADRRAFEMGFGAELLSALKHVAPLAPRQDSSSFGGVVVMSHPPARTRIARLEAMIRASRNR
jgi:Zn-dependent protease with chaperone function